MGISLYNLSTGSVIIMTTAAFVGHIFCAGDVIIIAFIATPMFMPAGLIQIMGLYKHPPIVWAVINTAYCVIRSKGGPTAIPASITPAHPGRSPFMTRYPNPAIVPIVCPATIVVASPSPRIVRYPGVAIFGHHPMPAGVGPESGILIGYENIAIPCIINPFTIRRKVIIKSLVRNSYVLRSNFVC